MEAVIGSVVCSKSGRDKGNLLCVVGESDKFFILADGKERPLQRPKRKNKKHVAVTSYCLSEQQMSANKALKRALREICAPDRLEDN